MMKIMETGINNGGGQGEETKKDWDQCQRVGGSGRQSVIQSP